MAHDPRSIANYILVIRQHFGFETTQLELQKLLYFCHGKYLTTYGEPLVDGYFEAWDHGPVHALVYREFSSYGRQPITNRAQSKNLITGETKVVAPPSEQKVKTLIAETVLQLRNLTASQLREKSHAKGGPWHSVRESAKVNLASGARIPDDVIGRLYNRHILPLNFDVELVDDYEDFPPESDGRGQYGSSAD